MDETGTTTLSLSPNQLDELVRLIGPDNVKFSEEELEWAGWDASGTYRLGSMVALAVRPVAVTFPANTSEVAAIVAWANRHRIPLVPRGAGTGVMGGAIPQRPAVVVDLSRLRHISIEADSMLVVAGAGATLSEVNAALRPHGLMLGHDPWSVQLATVGGALCTNGVGYLAGRWGSMADQVAAVEAVLADGTIVRTPLYKPTVGPDLRAMFAGSQGVLGIVTTVWLQAVPYPESQHFRSYRFRGFEAGYRAIMRLWRTGLRFDLLDFGDGTPAWFDVEPGMEDDDGRTAVLHLGAFGPGIEAEARLTVAHKIMLLEGGRDLGPEPATRFWEQRYEIAQQYALAAHNRRDAGMRRILGKTGHDYLNLALPPARLLEYRRQALDRVAEEPDIRALETGIWCRPELFSLLVREIHNDEPVDQLTGIDRDIPGRHPQRMEALIHDLLRLALKHGGTLEFIHGAGLKLLPLLPQEAPNVQKVLESIKLALDPNDIMNPGKLRLPGAMSPGGENH